MKYGAYAFMDNNEDGKSGDDIKNMKNKDIDEIYKELFNAKKTIYNDNHDIKIHGVPVELYVQTYLYQAD